MVGMHGPQEYLLLPTLICPPQQATRNFRPPRGCLAAPALRSPCQHCQSEGSHAFSWEPPGDFFHPIQAGVIWGGYQ